MFMLIYIIFFLNNFNMDRETDEEVAVSFFLFSENGIVTQTYVSDPNKFSIRAISRDCFVCFDEPILSRVNMSINT